MNPYNSDQPVAVSTIADLGRPPSLAAEQFIRVTSYGVAQDVRAGDVIFRPEDAASDLILIETGWIEIISPATSVENEAVVARYGPGGFLGELSLLTGQTAYLSARVAESGRIHRISQQQFRRIMADDPGISDILLRTFLLRRDLLRDSPAAHAIEIIGSAASAESLALRTYAARQRLPHLWFDADSSAGSAMMRTAELDATALPAVVAGRHLLRKATPPQLAKILGLAYRRTSSKPTDLTIVGTGPAGLAAAVYGASEGLATVVLDSVGIGGQAAASSRIENYLGFPSGISGSDLTQRAALQALKFGAQLTSPGHAVAITATDGNLRVNLADGAEMETRAVLIATGASYRSLPLARWKDFEGAGIYFAATQMEAQACAAEPVIVVGGANSAGQAALFLASHGSQVTVAIRAKDPAKQMSTYLLDRLQADPGITIRPSSEVTQLTGDHVLKSITLTDTTSATSEDQPCRGLFCFIGAVPATTWLNGIQLDADQFVCTDTNLDQRALGPVWAELGRPPLPFETSVPGIFAAGDVRSGSMKRVAAAVGEGSSAVRSIHAAIGFVAHT